MTERRRQFLAAVGLSNLCLLTLWSGLLSPLGKQSYLLKHPLSAMNYWCALAATVLLAGFFALWMTVIQRTGGNLQRSLKWLFLIILLVGVNSVRDVLSLAFPLLRGQLLRVAPGWVIALAAGAALVAYAVAGLIWTDRLYRAAVTSLMLMSPAVLVSAPQGLYRATHPPAELRDLAPAARLDSSSRPRVVWIIFDEVDQRILFEDRPANLQLPEFDRWRKTGLYAPQTYSPSGSTLTAIPSLLTGRPVEQADPRDESTLMLRFSGSSRWEKWGSKDSVFSEMRELGVNAGVAGWYHPYCRVLGGDVARCAWEDMPFKLTSYGERWSEILPNELRGLFETSLMSAFGQSLVTQQSIRNFQRLEKEAMEMAADPGLGFCFLHLQPAHAPFFYNRQDGSFSLKNSTVTGYYDALVLADRTLRRLRESMEARGVWKNTHVIVSSDHYYRTARMLDGKPGTRVPFLVRFAGEEEGVEFDGRLDSVVTRALVSKLVRGEVRSGREAVGILGREMASRH